MAEKKDKKQAEVKDKAKLYSYHSDKPVAIIGDATITHHGEGSAPIMAKVTFSEIIEGEDPQLMQQFIIKDPANGKKFTLQFIGERPGLEEFELGGEIFFRYPVEANKEYKVFIKECHE